MGFPASEQMLRYLRNKNTFSPDQRAPESMEQVLAPRMGLETFAPPIPRVAAPIVEEMPQPTFSSQTKSPRATPQADKFIEASNQELPQRKKPGIWRKIGASFSRPDEQEAVLYGSEYANAMKDRKIRLGELGTSAEREDQVNSMRSLEEYRDATTEDRSERTAIAEARLNGGKSEIDGSGNLFVLTQDGKVRYLGVSKMSEAEKIQAELKGDLTKIDAQRSAALQRIAAAGAQRILNTQEQGAQQRLNIAARGQNAGLVPIAIQNRITELRSRNPELGRRITINEDTGEIEFNNGDWWNKVPDMDSATKEAILNHLFDGTELPEMIARPPRRRNVFDQATPPTVPGPPAPNAAPAQDNVAPASVTPTRPVAVPPPSQGGMSNRPTAPAAVAPTSQGMSNRPTGPVVTPIPITPPGRPSAFTRPENQPPQEVPDQSLPPFDPNMVPGRGSPNERKITKGLNENQWRQRAMDELKKQGKVINEQTIKIVSERLKAANATAK